MQIPRLENDALRTQRVVVKNALLNRTQQDLSEQIRIDQSQYPINREVNNISRGEFQTARQYRSDMQMYKHNLSAERDTASIKKKSKRRNINVEQSPISKIGFSSIMT